MDLGEIAYNVVSSGDGTWASVGALHHQKSRYVYIRALTYAKHKHLPWPIPSIVEKSSLYNESSFALGKQAYWLRWQLAMPWAEIDSDIGRYRGHAVQLASIYALKSGLPWPITIKL